MTRKSCVIRVTGGWYKKGGVCLFCFGWRINRFKWCSSAFSVAYLTNFSKVVFVVFDFFSMEKLEGASRGYDFGRRGPRKRVAVSVDGDRSLKAAQTVVSSDTLCLEDIPVWRRRMAEDEVVEVDHHVKARDVKEDVVLLLAWESLDVMT